MARIEQVEITDRVQWMKLRGQDVTASVAGCLLGVHPYQTAYGLYLLKSGLVGEDPEETPPMKRGRLLEPVAFQMIREDKPGWTFQNYPVGVYFRDPAARLGATPDLIGRDDKDRKCVVQFKTVEPSVFRRTWKSETGEVEPPLWVICQGLIEAHLTGSEAAYVAPMVVGFGIEMPVIEIPLHDGIITRIKSEIGTFWKRIEDKSPPDPDYCRDGALIARLHPKDDGTTIDLSGSNRFAELLSVREENKGAISEAKERCDAAEAEIKSMIGDHTYAMAPDGTLVSWKTINRKAYEVAATTYRQLGTKKLKT